MGSSMTRRDVRRGPEDQDPKLFRDVGEAMLDAGGDEDQASRLHRAAFTCHGDGTATADHVVHLVFAMRLLPVSRSGRPDGEPHAEL